MSGYGIIWGDNYYFQVVPWGDLPAVESRSEIAYPTEKDAWDGAIFRIEQCRRQTVDALKEARERRAVFMRTPPHD